MTESKLTNLSAKHSRPLSIASTDRKHSIALHQFWSRWLDCGKSWSETACWSLNTGCLWDYVIRL